MDALKSLIHHEKQEKGSMLCAQHSLNAILQGDYFAADDLAEIARDLDALELQYRDRDAHVPSQSVNMDDTGYFSVQVMDGALRRWGLKLVPWTSQEMMEYHENPDSQQAFVLNLRQHWFTIRRFGATGGFGTWFNLNSSLQSPERVGVTYLGMVIQQAEAEGYSVFAVRPLTGEEAERQEGLNGIPTTHADELAAAIPDDGPFDPPDTFTHSGASGTEVDYTLEDEDIELQKALQASLAHSSNPSTIASFGFPDTPYASSSFDRVGSGSASSYPPAPVRQSSSSAESARREFNAVREIDADQELRASTARAKERLEQAKKEQQMALRAASRSNSNGASINQRNSVDAVGGSGRHPGDEAEDQEFRRAIAESLREAGHQPNEVEEVEMDDDDDYVPDDDDEEYIPPPRSSQLRSHDNIFPAPFISSASNPEAASIARPAPLHRVVDDEDAELQAALRASLEGLPSGFIVPSSPPITPKRIIHTTELSRQREREDAERAAAFQRSGQISSSSAQDWDEDEEEEDGDEPSRAGKGKVRASVGSPPPVEESLSMDEIRRRRLARFGGS